MEKNLELMVQLQSIDSEIARLDSLLKTLPTEIANYQNGLNAAKAEHKEFLDTLEEKNKLRLAKEREVEDKKEAVKKADAKLGEIKTNAEYTAAVKEIKNMKAAMEQLEDEQLEIMEELEDTSEAEAKYKTKVTEEQAAFDKIKTTKEAEIAEIKIKRDGTAGSRDNALNDIEPPYKKKYGDLLKSCAGIAVAEVVEGYCKACNTAIRPQMVVEIRGGSIHTCPICCRFIYEIEKEPEEETTEKTAEAKQG